MDAYEKLIDIMRKQGSVNNPIGLQLGEMTDATSCDVGELHLESDDLLISEHLTDYEIKIDTPTSTETKIKVHGKIKKGDLVLVQRTSDEKYVIIEKLLDAEDIK